MPQSFQNAALYSSQTPPPRLRPLPGYRRTAGGRGALEAASVPKTIPSTLIDAVNRVSPNRREKEAIMSPGRYVEAAQAEERVQHRMEDASCCTRRRLLASLPQPSTHAPASFMSEITNFVETQLQSLENLYPGVKFSDKRSTKKFSAKELELRLPGQGIELTPDERKRKQRLEIFIRGQRMFADSFPSYRLFLDAMADEHESYHRFIEEDLNLHKEVLHALRIDIQRREVEAQTRIDQVEADKTKLSQLLENERHRTEKLQTQLLEVTRQRHTETDAKRRIQQLENELQAEKDSGMKLKEALDDASRLNEQLFLTTFSDALDATQQQLNEVKTQCSRKDELLIDAHDEVAALTKDLKAIVRYCNDRMENELQSSDVRLTAQGIRILFPAEARKVVPKAY